MSGADLFLRWEAAEVPEVAPGVWALVKLGEAVEVGRITLAPGTVMRPHAHPEEQFFYVLSGRLWYRIGTVEDEAGPGDLVHMPSGVPHEGRAIGSEPAEFVEIKERRRVTTEEVR